MMGSRKTVTERADYMKKELECLKELLASKVMRFNKGLCKQCYYSDSVPIVFDVSNGHFVLKECEKALLNHIPLCNLGVDTLILKPDNFNIRFYKTDTYNKACDYLVLTYDKTNKPHAVFVDLKTDIYDQPNPKTCEFKTNSERDALCGLQFCGARALYKLLALMTRTLSKCRAFDSYQEHYWVLYKNYLNGCGVIGAVPTLTEGSGDAVKTFRRSSLLSSIYARKVKNNESIDITCLL